MASFEAAYIYPLGWYWFAEKAAYMEPDDAYRLPLRMDRLTFKAASIPPESESVTPRTIICRGHFSETLFPKGDFFISPKRSKS